MGVEMSYVNVRFTREVNGLIRRGKKRGDMSRRVAGALSSVDLAEVALIARRGECHGRMTQVVVPGPLKRRGKEVAAARQCSLNCLVNSALAIYLK